VTGDVPRSLTLKSLHEAIPDVWTEQEVDRVRSTGVERGGMRDNEGKIWRTQNGSGFAFLFSQKDMYKNERIFVVFSSVSGL